MGQSHCILQGKSRCLLYYRNNTPPSLSLTITTYFGEQLTIGNEGRRGVLKQPSFSRCYTPTDSMTLSVLTFWTLVKSTIVLLRAVFIPHSVRQLKKGFNSTRREDIQHSISILYYLYVAFLCNETNILQSYCTWCQQNYNNNIYKRGIKIPFFK